MKNDWTLRVGFGPQLESYAPGEFSLTSPTLNLQSSTAQFVARDCMQYYEFWDHGWIRWIDEPTNEVFIEALKKKDYAIGVNLFHPKIVLGNGYEGPVNPGLSDKLPLLQLTRNFLALSVYVDKVLPLAEGRWGALDYRAGIGAGIYIGYARSETEQFGGRDEPMAIIGALGILRQGLVYTEPSGHVSLGANFDLSKGFLDYPLLDGRAKQSMEAWKAGVHIAVQLW